MSFSTDRIVSVSAMVVGVASLFIIVYQTHLMREAQRASVLPYLMIAIRSNDDGAFLGVRNAGIGPAIIDHVRVLHEGRATDGDPYDFFVAKRPDRDRDELSIDRLIAGRLMPAGESVQMIGMGGKEGLQMLRDLLALFELAEVPKTWLDRLELPRVSADRAILEITYSSVYGDQWRARSDRVVPEQVE